MSETRTDDQPETTPPENPDHFTQGEVVGTWFTRVRGQDRIFAAYGAGTSFGENPLYNVFRLGGPLRLGAFRSDEVLGANYVLGDLGYLKRIGRLPDVLGGNVFVGSWLETGTIDFARGSFPYLTKGIRRQPIWIERYVSVVRNNHPRLRAEPSLKSFAAEKHVLVSTFGTGHAHQLAERAVEAAIPAENIICRVPIFLAASIIAKHSDAVATLPLSIATVLAEDLDLAVITPPIKLPKIEISQYWHERFHREPGNQWIRSIFARLFRVRASSPRADRN